MKESLACLPYQEHGSDRHEHYVYMHLYFIRTSVLYILVLILGHVINVVHVYICDDNYNTLGNQYKGIYKKILMYIPFSNWHVRPLEVQ